MPPTPNPTASKQLLHDVARLATSTVQVLQQLSVQSREECARQSGRFVRMNVPKRWKPDAFGKHGKGKSNEPAAAAATATEDAFINQTPTVRPSHMHSQPANATTTNIPNSPSPLHTTPLSTATIQTAVTLSTSPLTGATTPSTANYHRPEQIHVPLLDNDKKQRTHSNDSTATSATIPVPSNESSSTTPTSSTIPSSATPLSTSASSAASVDTASSSSSTSFSQASLDSSSTYHPRERSVPSSSLGRFVGFAGIAMNLVVGTVGDVVTDAIGMGKGKKKEVTTEGSSTVTNEQIEQEPKSEKRSLGLSSLMSEANTERLAAGLCRMRGAALKVGQMLSIQDEHLLPPELQAVLDRVRDGADVMPRRQLTETLNNELGADWEQRLQSFDWQPIAAASIGQVHRAVLTDGRKVVMKVQYPGVAESIESDVNNLKRLIRFVNVLPKGMYIDETMKAAKEELAIECDYSYELQCQQQFRQLLQQSKYLSTHCHIPEVIPEFSTKRILTSELVAGVPIDKTAVGATYQLDQKQRDHVAFTLLKLCLHELFVFRFMQTDPNWSNFLYNLDTGMVELIDFGASREYAKPFVDEYLRMVHACAERNRDGVISSSIKMGFLTGEESKEMINAHVEAAFIIGEPFGTDEPYDFVSANIAGRVSKLASVMLRLRLTPPPKEAYTLHRKLSGAFLTCKKLGAKVACRQAFMEIYNNHKFD